MNHDDDDLPPARERHPDPRQWNNPAPYSPMRLLEIVAPVLLASALTGATTVAVLGERIEACKENQRAIAEEIRQLRRDLYRPHNMRVPFVVRAPEEYRL
jgi:hypothetical protein